MALLLKGLILEGKVIRGYILYNTNDIYNHKVYCVTREYGMELAKKHYIKDATFSSNGQCDRVIHNTIKMHDMHRIGLDEFNTLGLELLDNIPDIEELTSDTHVTRFKILGCVFNTYGVIEGFKIDDSRAIRTLRLKDIDKAYGNIKNRYTKVYQLTKDLSIYTKHCWRYNFCAHKLWGGILAAGFKLDSPFANAYLANELFGKENNIFNYGAKVDERELAIRNKLLSDARDIEYNIIGSNKVYRIDKNKCKIVAKVEYLNMDGSRVSPIDLLIIEYNNKYILVYKHTISKVDTDNLLKVRLYYDEVMYKRPYQDGKYLVISNVGCSKGVKHNIYEYIHSGKLTIEEFKSKTLPNV